MKERDMMCDRNIQLIDTQFFQENQSWCFEQSLIHGEGLRFQVRIRRNAHDNQSHAIGELFTKEGWKVIVNLPMTPRLQCHQHSYVERNLRDFHFQNDAEQIFGQMFMLLDI